MPPRRTRVRRTGRGDRPSTFTSTLLIATLLGSATVAACVGEISGGGEVGADGRRGGPSGGGGEGNGTGSGGSTNTPEEEAKLKLATRRLSHTEFLNSAADLFGLDRKEEADKWTMFNPQRFRFTEDSWPDGYDNDGNALQPSALLVGQYDEFARELAKSRADELIEALPCQPDEGDSCARTFISTFGKRAFRRPLAQDEVDFFADLFWTENNSDFEVGVRLVVQAMLLSPEFLYRVELGRPGDPASLTSYETASRLSYLLWRTMPDADLFAAADADELATQAGVDAQVERMLQDPRVENTFTDFFEQWLKIETLSTRSKQGDGYPGHEPLEQETERFIRSVLYRNEGTLSDLFTSREAEVNATLAGFYGVSGPGSDDTWQPVTLPPERSGGILTRGGFLANYGHPENPSPVLRGVFILERVLCIDLGQPPANAQSMAAIPDGADPQTNREEYELMTSATACQSCHKVINPLGFGFENFDSKGRYRTEENGVPIDASGTVIGAGKFEGPAELANMLAEDDRTQSCVSEHWLRFALGGAVDAPLHDHLQTVLADNDLKLRSMLRAVATDPRYWSVRKAGE